VKYLSALLLGVFMVSCTPAYNLEVMPTSYNVEEANEQYLLIAELRAEYFKLSAVHYKLQELVNDAQNDRMAKSVDYYLYWSSVAMIHIYHSAESKLHEAVIKAHTGLMEYKAVLLEIITSSQL